MKEERSQKNGLTLMAIQKMAFKYMQKEKQVSQLKDFFN